MKKWYGLKDPESYRYLPVHEGADIEHSQVEKKMLLEIVQPREEETVLESVEITLDALGNFLSSFDI